jgi:hypothetical protein
VAGRPRYLSDLVAQRIRPVGAQEPTGDAITDLNTTLGAIERTLTAQTLAISALLDLIRDFAAEIDERVGDE